MTLKIIDKTVNDTLEKQSHKLSDNLIEPIHPDINVRYNSVNVIVGKKSSGKTVIALSEIIKISLLNTYHLLIYMTKNGDENDKSFQSLKHIMKIPYVTFNESKAKEAVVELISAKNLYYLIKREHLEDKVIDEQKEDMFNVLHIKDFDIEFLHTLILFDDITNSKLFSSEESFFKQQLRRCRQISLISYSFKDGKE